MLLGEVEIVTIERVLRTNSTPRHASSAKVATHTIGTLAVEVGIGDSLVGLAKEDAYFSGMKMLFASPCQPQSP